MVNSWRVLDSRSAVILKPYFEKIGVAACPKCGKDIVLRKTKKEDIMDVKIIRNVILCHGQSRHLRNVRSAEEYMVEKGNKLACANEQCGFSEETKKDEKN